MKIAINTAAAVLLLASAPAFAHGGGMGHIGGSMGGNMGSISQRTMPADHDHHNWHYTKTTNTIGKSHIIRLKTVKVSKIVLERQIVRLKLELTKLRAEGRGNSFEARRLLYREMALAKLINT